VVYSTHAPAIQFEPMSKNKNFLFAGNIFLGDGDVVHGPSSGEKFISNVWWNAGKEITFRGHKSLAEWSNTEWQAAGRQIDPKLEGPFLTTITDPYQLHTLTGYTLLKESPLRNSRLDLHDLQIPFVRQDFFDNPVSSQSTPGIQQAEKN